MGDRCAFPSCTHPVEVVYYRWPLCHRHWSWHGVKYDVYVEMAKPKDFDRRLVMIQKLLKEASDETARKFGPEFSGRLELFRFKPYLTGKAQDRLPTTWEALGKEDEDNHNPDEQVTHVPEEEEA